MSNLSLTAASADARGITDSSFQKKTREPTSAVSFQDAIATTNAAAAGDKLTISQEGQAALAENNSAGPVSSQPATFSTGGQGMPDWMSEHFIPIGPLMTYGWQHQAGNGGKLANADGNVAGEYIQLVLKHYRELLENNGIDTPEKYYNQLIADPVRNAELHQLFNESLLSDPRAVELMQRIGIVLS